MSEKSYIKIKKEKNNILELGFTEDAVCKCGKKPTQIIAPNIYFKSFGYYCDECVKGPLKEYEKSKLIKI